MEEQLANLRLFLAAGTVFGFALAGWLGKIRYQLSEAKTKNKELDRDLKVEVSKLEAAQVATAEKFNKSLSRVWVKWDEHQVIYSKDRLADAKEFASRSELASAVNKLDADIKDMERRISDSVGSMKTEIKEDIAALKLTVDRVLEQRGH